MMEGTTNGEEKLASFSSVEDENPFGDGDRIMEGVQIHTDEETAAEEARKAEIRQQMEKVCGRSGPCREILAILYIYLTRLHLKVLSTREVYWPINELKQSNRT